MLQHRRSLSLTSARTWSNIIHLLMTEFTTTPHVICLFVCLLSYLKKHSVNFTNVSVLHILPVVVARSSSDGSAIRYVLPVLWMTACFYIMHGVGQNKRERVFCPIRRMAAPAGAKSAVSDCTVNCH